MICKIVLPCVLGICRLSYTCICVQVKGKLNAPFCLSTFILHLSIFYNYQCFSFWITWKVFISQCLPVFTRWIKKQTNLCTEKLHGFLHIKLGTPQLACMSSHNNGRHIWLYIIYSYIIHCILSLSLIVRNQITQSDLFLFHFWLYEALTYSQIYFFRYTQCTSLKNTVEVVRWLYVTNKNIASLPFCIIIYNGLAWSSLYVSFFALWNISDDTKHRCLITEKT